MSGSALTGAEGGTTGEALCAAVDAAGVRRLADLLGDWMVGAVHPDGRMISKYWPSPDNEVRVDNVQHNLLAVLTLLEGWSDGDFTAEPAP